MPRIIEIKQKVPAFYLTWVVNNICTNACDYCPEKLHNGKNHHYSWEHAEHLARLLINQYPKINVAISGGEPTVSPWLPQLVKMFSDAGHSVGITTNGARTARYFSEISKHLSYVVMSYHPSYEDPEFLEKALACAEHTVTTVSVMFDSRYFDKCLDIYHKLGKHENIAVNPVRIQAWRNNTTAGSDYTEEQIKVLTTLEPYKNKFPVKPKNPGIIGANAYYDDGSNSQLDAQKLINNLGSNFKGWECDIGLNSLFVQHDGRLKLANCVSAPGIGNIQDLNLVEWPKNTFICPQTFCHCTTDVYVPKRKLTQNQS